MFIDTQNQRRTPKNQAQGKSNTQLPQFQKNYQRMTAPSFTQTPVNNKENEDEEKTVLQQFQQMAGRRGKKARRGSQGQLSKSSVTSTSARLYENQNFLSSPDVNLVCGGQTISRHDSNTSSVAPKPYYTQVSSNSFFNQAQPNQRKAHIVYVDTDTEDQVNEAIPEPQPILQAAKKKTSITPFEKKKKAALNSKSNTQSNTMIDKAFNKFVSRGNQGTLEKSKSQKVTKPKAKRPIIQTGRVTTNNEDLITQPQAINLKLESASTFDPDTRGSIREQGSTFGVKDYTPVLSKLDKQRPQIIRKDGQMFSSEISPAYEAFLAQHQYKKNNPQQQINKNSRNIESTLINPKQTNEILDNYKSQINNQATDLQMYQTLQPQQTNDNQEFIIDNLSQNTLNAYSTKQSHQSKQMQKKEPVKKTLDYKIDQVLKKGTRNCMIATENQEQNYSYNNPNQRSRTPNQKQQATSRVEPISTDRLSALAQPKWKVERPTSAINEKKPRGRVQTRIPTPTQDQQRRASIGSLSQSRASITPSMLYQSNLGTRKASQGSSSEIGRRTPSQLQQRIENKLTHTNAQNYMRQDCIAEKAHEKTDLQTLIKQMRNTIIQTKKQVKQIGNENLQSKQDVKQLKNLLPAKEQKINLASKQTKDLSMQVKSLGQDCCELGQCQQVLVDELQNEQELIQELQNALASVKKNLNEVRKDKEKVVAKLAKTSKICTNLESMCEVARSDNTKLYSQFKMALGTKKPSNNGGLNASFISTQVINKSQITQSRRASIGRLQKTDFISNMASNRGVNLMIDNVDDQFIQRPIYTQGSSLTPRMTTKRQSKAGRAKPIQNINYNTIV